MEKFNQLLRSGEPYVLSIFRIVVGLSLFQFGVAKIFKFPLVAPFDKVQMFSLFWDAAVIEIVGGALVAVGLFTRIAAFICSGEMAVAYFMFHAPKSFWPAVNQGDAAILFCFLFLYLAFAGAGAWSIDAALSNSQPKLARA